jgi:hypothetical protein
MPFQGYEHILGSSEPKGLCLRGDFALKTSWLNVFVAICRSFAGSSFVLFFIVVSTAFLRMMRV